MTKEILLSISGLHMLEEEDGKEAWDCMQAVRDLLSIQFSTASLGG